MIKNKSKKTIISKKYCLCKSNASKARGLMFRIKPKPLIFVFEKEKIVSLHMMFVFFPIDVVYLNKNKKVVEIKSNFRPFRLYSPKKNAMYVIELPENTIKKSRTSIGDSISFS